MYCYDWVYPCGYRYITFYSVFYMLQMALATIVALEIKLFNPKT